MKVIDDRKTHNPIPFYLLNIGETFIFKDKLYIKLGDLSIYESAPNSFDCHLRKLVRMLHDECVELVNVEIHIIEEE